VKSQSIGVKQQDPMSLFMHVSTTEYLTQSIGRAEGALGFALPP
jgi:hypothetical protein